METPRKSKIRKTITRTFYNKSIKIPKYESVVVEVSFEEDVEWNSLEERQKKSDGITNLLKKDFNDTTNNLFAKIQYGKNEDPVQKDLEDSRQEVKEDNLADNELDKLLG